MFHAEKRIENVEGGGLASGRAAEFELVRVLDTRVNPTESFSLGIASTVPGPDRCVERVGTASRFDGHEDVCQVIDDGRQSSKVSGDAILISFRGKTRGRLEIGHEVGDELCAVESSLLDPGTAAVELALIGVGISRVVEEGGEPHVIGRERFGFVVKLKVPEYGIGVGENRSNLEPLRHLCAKGIRDRRLSAIGRTHGQGDERSQRGRPKPSWMVEVSNAHRSEPATRVPHEHVEESAYLLSTA